MDIFKELNLKNLTVEEKNQILVQFTDSLLKRLMVRVSGKLSEADQSRFDALVEGGNVEEINKFLSKKVPDFEEIRDEEAKAMIEEMKDFFATSKL